MYFMLFDCKTPRVFMVYKERFIYLRDSKNVIFVIMYDALMYYVLSIMYYVFFMQL